MEKSPLKKYVPDMSWMDNYPVLRPLHRRFADPALWTLNRRSVSRGVSLGIFFGILTPVAQILFASIAAIALRANLPIAAVSTLVSNPFTFPAKATPSTLRFPRKPPNTRSTRPAGFRRC
jgi:uncharacterized protein